MLRCEVCLGEDFERLVGLPGGQGEYLECRRCGLVRLETSLTFDYTGPEYVEALVRQALSGDALHRTILERIEAHHRPGMLVEVGCSVGTQLAAARKRGWDVLGYDVNPDCPAIAHHLHRVEVRCEDFLTVEQRGFADVILMNQFIEHVTDPRPFLDASRRYLRPGGLVVLGTPNWDAITPFIWLSRRLGAPLPPVDHIRPPQHLRLYRPSTVRQLGRELGWTTLGIYDNPTDYFGHRGRVSPRRLLADVGRLVAWASRDRWLVSMNLLAILTPELTTTAATATRPTT